MERRVLVIGTGGTIASEPTVNGYAPVGPPCALPLKGIGLQSLHLKVYEFSAEQRYQLRTSSFFRRIRHHPQLSDFTAVNTPNPYTPSASSPRTGSPTRQSLEQLQLTSPSPSRPRWQVEDEEVVTVQKGKNTLYPALRTPELDDEGQRVVYEILDLDRHMDSSEMTPSGE